MKKKELNVFVLGILLFIAFMGLTGCSNPLVGDDSNNNTKTTVANAENAIDYTFNLAKLKAINHMLAISNIDNKWENAKISDNFFWYNPLIKDKPTYVEFKVTNNGNDQGYVIVSLTENDFEIPEYHTEGKAMYEYLQNKSGSIDIKGTRFNSFSYMGEFIDSRAANKKVFLGTLEYLDNEETTREVENQYDEYLENYIKKREDIGGIGGSKEELEKYYKVKKESEEINKRNILTRGNPTPPYNSPISASVQESNLLPTYNQYSINGNWSGCTPTAGAIILAYWYRKHGRTRLFSSTPSLTFSGMGTNEKNVVETLGNQSYMKTIYGSTGSGTTAFNAWDGLWKYVANKNYSHWVIRWYWVDHNSDEGQYLWANTTNDWNNIYTEISSNRPAMLHYKESGGDHSSVIYEITINRDVWNSTVNDVYCSIITGWGDPGVHTTQARKTINTGSWVFYEVVTCNIY